MSTTTINLMFCGRPFEVDARRCYNHKVLSDDFELRYVIDAMARMDGVIREVCAAALFCPLRTEEEIAFRREILIDARRSPDAFKRLYELAADAERIYNHNKQMDRREIPDRVSAEIDLFSSFLELLRRFRKFADENGAEFTSEGMARLFAMLKSELNDGFFDEARREADALAEIDTGELSISVKLGDDLCDVSYTLRKKGRGAAMQWLTARGYNFAPDNHSVDWDDRAFRALAVPTDAVGAAAGYMLSFFDMLRRELAFYMGCLNLEETLGKLGQPLCIPRLLPDTGFSRMYRGLYDAALALSAKRAVVGNDLDAQDTKLYIITGANQGGKSTFLRSIGQAQLMAQCGMPVAAELAEIPLRRMVFSHFKREEDGTMRSGKLDEEMRRMNDIVEYMEPRSTVFLNESFSSTNEREGAELCGQMTRAFVKNNIEVFSVTHLYTYAASFSGATGALSLRAQRLGGGERTFKLEAGEPLSTAFGEDLYAGIFNNA